MNNLLHDEVPRFRKSNRFAVAVAWLVILIGLVSMTGWISGTMWLTRFVDTQVPIAPITIILFFICSLALLALIRFQKTNKNRLLFLLPASLVVLLSGFLAIARMMDIRIPCGDGYETTRAIRAFNPGVIIIAQTAHAAVADRQKALEAGCDDHIAKPVRKEDLFELIGRK